MACTYRQVGHTGAVCQLGRCKGFEILKNVDTHYSNDTDIIVLQPNEPNVNTAIVKMVLWYSDKQN